mgnify:CR=1 FL=1
MIALGERIRVPCVCDARLLVPVFDDGLVCRGEAADGVGVVGRDVRHAGEGVVNGFDLALVRHVLFIAREVEAHRNAEQHESKRDDGRALCARAEDAEALFDEHLGDTPRFLDSYCYYDEKSNTKDYALTAAQAEQVYAALMQDVQDSDNGGSDIFAVQEYQYVSPISFWLELYFESTNEKGRPEVYTLGPNVNNSTPNTLQVLSELLPELKSNIVTPPSDDGIHTLPATEDVSTEESVN